MPAHGHASIPYEDPLVPGTVIVGFDETKERFSNYYLCDGITDDGPWQDAADDLIAAGGGRYIVEPGEYGFTAEVLFDGDEFPGGWAFDPNGTIEMVGLSQYSVIINTAELEYGLRVINGCSINFINLKFVLPNNNAQPAIYGDGTGLVYSASIYRGGLHNIRVTGGNATVGLYCIHLQNPFRWTFTGNNFFSVQGIGTGVNFSCGICIENEDGVTHYGDGTWEGYFNASLGSEDAVGFYFWGSGTHLGAIRVNAYLFASNDGSDPGTTLVKIDNAHGTTFLGGWACEILQYGFVMDEAYRTKIWNGGVSTFQDDGIVFDNNDTCRFLRVITVSNIKLAAGGITLTIMDDDENTASRASYYRDMRVESGATDTVQWQPSARTVLERIIWWDNGTEKFSECSGVATITGAVNLVDVTHNLIDVPDLVLLTPHDMGAGLWELTTKDVAAAGTQFQISFTNAPGVATWSWDWRAYWHPDHT